MLRLLGYLWFFLVTPWFYPDRDKEE